MVDFADLDFPDGGDNDAGIASYIYLAKVKDVLNWPTLPPTPTTLAQKVTLTGNFEMKEGKRFYKLYCTRDKGDLNSDMVGEMDSKSAENKLKIFIPRTTPENIGFLEECKNTNVVAISVERDGSMRVIGSELLPAKLFTGKAGSGSKAGDAKGIDVEISSVGRIAPFYTGTIPLTPAPPTP